MKGYPYPSDYRGALELSGRNGQDFEGRKARVKIDVKGKIVVAKALSEEDFVEQVHRVVEQLIERLGYDQKLSVEVVV